MRPLGPGPVGIVDDSPEYFADTRAVGDSLYLVSGPLVVHNGHDHNCLCRGHRRDSVWMNYASQAHPFRCAPIARSLDEDAQTDDWASRVFVNQDASVAKAKLTLVGQDI